MRAAPPVRTQVARDRAWLSFVAALSGAAVAAATLWLASWGELRAAPWVALLTGSAAAALAWRFARVDTGMLQWDGQQWTFEGRSGDPRVALDLGSWVLLRFDAATGGRAWLAVGQASAALAWHGLRAAVYSRRPNADPDPTDTAQRT